MRKIKLYVDFDGVILNSIDVSYRMIKEQFGENPIQEDVDRFYRSLNWDQFISECLPINDSISHLKKIIDSGLYDVTVLTHVLSLHEEEVKEKYLKDVLPDIHFIPVTKPNPKWKMVDCRGCVLVDDYSLNLDLWKEHDGIPVKFSLKDKEYDYLTICSLDELISLYSVLESDCAKALARIKS